MLYNLGQVLSTALSLTIVGAALPARLKNVLYSGKNNVISAVDFAFVIHGYRWVIIALIGTSLLALEPRGSVRSGKKLAKALQRPLDFDAMDAARIRPFLTDRS
jgi:hypothetical protein